MVRVRLQAQQNGSPPAPLPQQTPALQGSQSEGTRPWAPPRRQLGVTACCREVFWASNTPATVCLAPSTQQSLLNSTVCSLDNIRQRTFTSTIDGLQKIAKHEGFTSLWRGLSPTLVMSIPGNVIYFTGYDLLRYDERSPIRKHVRDGLAPAVAGSIARAAAAVFVSPIEMFRVRLQATASAQGQKHSVFVHTLQGMRTMTKNVGVASLWRGLGLTMWRDVPFSAIYWWGYEATRRQLHRLRTESAETPHSRTISSISGDAFIAGTVSGAFASIVTTPFDVGKTRKQVFQYQHDGSSRDSTRPLNKPPNPIEGQSIPRLLRSIYQNEGLAGLFRGGVPRLAKVAPACAIMVSTFELSKLMASKANANIS